MVYLIISSYICQTKSTIHVGKYTVSSHGPYGFQDSKDYWSAIEAFELYDSKRLGTWDTSTSSTIWQSQPGEWQLKHFWNVQSRTLGK